MGNPTYDRRWEILGEPIGQGGQGKVFHVLDKEAVRADLKIREDMVEAIRMIGRIPGSVEEKVEQALPLKRAVQDIHRGLLPKNQGALKVLPKPEEARDPKNAAERIGQEIRAMAGVKHPNLLKILDQDAEQTWFVAEYHPRGTLEKQMENEIYKGDLLGTLRSLRPVVAGVAELHRRSLVHRDIKPKNIFIAQDGRLVLGDFGLVYFTDQSRTRLSETFDIVGSWEWMPGWAQTIRPEDVRPAFDVFTLTKVIWTMVSNLPRLPFWYYDRHSFNLEKLFPDSPEMQFANSLFAKCIVEEERDCLPDAQALLREVDETLALAERHSRRKALCKRYKAVFETGQPESASPAMDDDYFYAQIEELQEIHIVILSMLHGTPPSDKPNVWLQQQPNVLVRSAFNDLVRMGLAREASNAPGWLVTPADYHFLQNLPTDKGRSLAEFLHRG